MCVARIKRAMDIATAVGALVLLLPLFAAAAFIIKCRSPGPILFKQARVGLHGREFMLLKFRTMHVHEEGVVGGTTTLREDARVFPGGALLRRYKVDELPQVINVVRGEMSIVGPRPTVRSDFDRMTDKQRRRVHVRPGLTGLAQVHGNTSLTWPERIELDLDYVDNQSLSRDIAIVARTLVLILSGRADTHPVSGDEWSR